jgi:hypothetical protein
LEAVVTSLHDYIQASQARFVSSETDERLGQAYFNQLVAERPELAERVRGTLRDPFYDNRRLSAFLNYIGENW